MEIIFTNRRRERVETDHSHVLRAGRLCRAQTKGGRGRGGAGDKQQVIGRSKEVDLG